MARRAIGLELIEGELRAVQLKRSHRSLTVERMVRVPATRDVLSGKGLRALISRERLRTDASVVLGVGIGEVAFAHLDTELSNVDHVRGVARFELEGDLPQSAEDIAADAAGPLRVTEDGKNRFFIAAASQPALDARIQAVTSAGLACELVETEAGALHTLSQVCHPHTTSGRYAAIHQTQKGWILIVGVEGRLAAARALSWFPVDSEYEMLAEALLRELDLSWRQVFDEPCGKDERATVLLSCPDFAFASRLARELGNQFPIKVSALNPAERFDTDQGEHIDEALTLPLGLALRGVGEGGTGMNLYATRTLPVKLAAEIRRQLTIALALVGVVVVVACATVQLQVYRLESTREAQKATAKALFSSALPGERPLKPLPQLQAKMQTIDDDLERLGDRADVARSSPLRLLEILSRHTEAGEVAAITELEIEGRSIELRVLGSSEAGMEALRRDLAAVEDFATVDIDDVETVGGGIRFTVDIELNGDHDERGGES